MEVTFHSRPAGPPPVKERDLPNGFYYGQIRGFNDVFFLKEEGVAFVFNGEQKHKPRSIELVFRTATDTIRARPVTVDGITVTEL